MSEFDLLRNALKQNIFILGSSSVCDRSTLKLIEESKTSKLRTITITGFSGDKIVLKPDKSLCPISSIFKSIQGECTNCDYVIITKFQERGHVFYIEMKSQRKDTDKDIVSKFKSSTCSVSYISCVLDKFYNNSQLHNNYDHRYILFYKLPIDKSSTKIKKQPKNITPENALEYGLEDGDEVPLPNLICD